MSKTINAGRVTFVPKDNFSNNISYKKFDIVTYNGSSYFAKKDTIGHTPTEDEFWQLVAEKGQNGAPGAVKMQVVDTLPETGETDTIYLVKKDNPGEQNLYDEYVYTDTGWEHIGDTSVDLSDYYTKEESDEKLLTKQDKLLAGDNITISEDNVISSNIGLPVLENQEINIHTFPVGSYIITGTDTVIKYGMNGASSYKPITINSHTGNTDSWVLNITHNSGGESNRGFAFLFRNYGFSGTTAFYTFDFSGMKSIDTNMIMQSNTNQSIYGQFDFYHALPISSLVPSTDNELTNKKYVDDTISAKGGDKLHDYNIYTITLDDYNLKGTFPTITDTTTLAKFDEILTDIYKKRIAANATRDHAFLIVYSQADTFIFRTSTIEASYCNLYGTYVEQPIDHRGYTCSYTFSITGTLDTTAQTFKTTKVKFDRNSKRVLLTNNTLSYTPTGDYNPATKKYVDEQVGNINTILATLTTVSEVTK